MEVIILIIGVVVFVAHIFTALFERTGIPDVLLLMILGILAGPVLGVVTPADFGKVGGIITTISLIVILFEGGTTLDIKNLTKAMGPTLSIALATFFASVFLATLFCYLILDFKILEGLMLGTIIGGTSSAVVVPLVRGLKMKEPVSTILILESAITDVLCIVFTIAFIQAAMGEAGETGKLVGSIFASLVVAAVIGVAGGFVWLLFLDKIRQFPNTIFTTFAFIFILYGMAEKLGFSGAITALSFGIALTNLKVNTSSVNKFSMLHTISHINEVEKTFYREMVFLLKTFFFIYLGISIKFDNFLLTIFAFVLVVAIYVGRLFITKFVLNKNSTIKEASLVSVMVPKGLAAAVLAGIPIQFGIKNGDKIQTVVYSIVLISIILTSGIVPFIEKLPIYKILFGKFRNSDLAIDEENHPIPENNIESEKHSIESHILPLQTAFVEKKNDLIPEVTIERKLNLNPELFVEKKKDLNFDIKNDKNLSQEKTF
ncbi:cation:proton antiporter, partial [bacterium]|nr:cation:proton antiporter [bacterium]